MRKICLQEGERFEGSRIDRTGAFDKRALEAAAGIIVDVQERGDVALRELTERFDGVSIDTFCVGQDEIDAAASRLPAETLSALEHAARQIREFHERQVEQSWFSVRADGALVGAKVTPLDSVGVYVPGGRALYPSSVLMNAIPASVAGVGRIVCATPPSKTGRLDAGVLCACKLAGVTEVYCVGGAQAVAALAYGTESIAPVCKITGPGNAFVAAAKKLVSGDVGIDMIAGPSEVCVVADGTADPRMVAIDLMAQAEHDPQAACYLVCFSEAYVDAVLEAIEGHMAQSTRADITRASLDNKGLAVVCMDRAQAAQVVNVIAPEHLELHLADAMDMLGSVRNAGAVFVGEWTAEAIGDYIAGPNHTLPTGGTARYASPLSTADFVKHTSVIRYTPEAIRADAEDVMRLATHEGLWAHARSIELRRDLVAAGGAAAVGGEA